MGRACAYGGVAFGLLGSGSETSEVLKTSEV
jgi:hypothetical protein